MTFNDINIKKGINIDNEYNSNVVMFNDNH